MGLIVDTGVFIRVERGGQGELATALPRSEATAISAITASKLLEGVFRANSEIRARILRERVERFLSDLAVVPFTLDIARVHARLRARLRLRGQSSGAHDLLIAATAVQLGWGVLTTKARDFTRVDGLRVVPV